MRGLDRHRSSHIRCAGLAYADARS
jgi:hypothetical protein